MKAILVTGTLTTNAYKTEVKIMASVLFKMPVYGSNGQMQSQVKTRRLVASGFILGQRIDKVSYNNKLL